MSQERPQSPLLAALEARQDQLLQQLDELNRQLEAALKQYAKTPESDDGAKKAA